MNARMNASSAYVRVHLVMHGAHVGYIVVVMLEWKEFLKAKYRKNAEPPANAFRAGILE